MTVLDPDFQRHYKTWIGFTWFVKIGLTSVIVLLALLGYFLV